MIIISHLMALGFRLLFMLLAIFTLCQCIYGKAVRSQMHLTAIGSLVALFASRAVVTASVHTLLLLVCLLVMLVAFDLVASSKMFGSTDISVPLLLLLGIGVVICFDTMPTYVGQNALRLVAGFAACLVTAMLLKRKP